MRRARTYSSVSIAIAELSEVRRRLDNALSRSREESRRVAESCWRLFQTTKSIEDSQNAIARHTQVRREGRKVTLNGTVLEALTPREIEVLRLIAGGNSTKELAGRLNISFKTAVTHRTNLMKKLDVHESASLVRLAVHYGLVAA